MKKKLTSTTVLASLEVLSIEVLRKKLIKSIEENGTLSPITIDLSQQLDKFIVAEMKRRY